MQTIYDGVRLIMDEWINEWMNEWMHACTGRWQTKSVKKIKISCLMNNKQKHN
jgi:hypothetical protein